MYVCVYIYIYIYIYIYVNNVKRFFPSAHKVLRRGNIRLCILYDSFYTKEYNTE